MNATEYEMPDAEYEQVLNDIYGTVNICGSTYDQGYLNRKLDPTGFRCGKNDYQDSSGQLYQCGECEKIFATEEDAESCCKEEE